MLFKMIKTRQNRSGRTKGCRSFEYSRW